MKKNRNIYFFFDENESVDSSAFIKMHFRNTAIEENIYFDKNLQTNVHFAVEITRF